MMYRLRGTGISSRPVREQENAEVIEMDEALMKTAASRTAARIDQKPI